MTIHDRLVMFPPWYVVKASHIMRDEADLSIFAKANPNTRLSSVTLISPNMPSPSEEISQPLALVTKPEAAQHITCTNNSPGLITNSRNVVVSGGNFTVSLPLT